VQTRQHRPEYLYFSPGRLDLIGMAAAVGVGAISCVALLQLWPGIGFLGQGLRTAVVAAIQPDPVSALPDRSVTSTLLSPSPAIEAAVMPTHSSARMSPVNSTSSSVMEPMIAAPAPIIADPSVLVVRRTKVVSHSVSKPHRRQARATASRRSYSYSGSYTARNPGGWW
jgi:hypothetical protein